MAMGKGVFSSDAIKRRMTQKAGKVELSPSNTKPAGSMIKPGRGKGKAPAFSGSAAKRRLGGLKS